MVRERALDSIEILAEERGCVGIGITTRIAEVPELIMLSYPRGVAKGIDHWCPARSSFLQAVDENHRRPRWIELLQPAKHCCVRISSPIHDRRETTPSRPYQSKQAGRR